MMRSPNLLSRHRPIKVRYVVPLVGLTVAVGLVVVIRIFAAGPAASFVVSGGAVSGKAMVVSNSSAIGGKMVVFGMSPTPMPTPAATPTPVFTPTPAPPAGSAKPDGTNTGVPAGQVLAVVSGDQTYGAASNSQTISNKDFHGFVKVTGSGITFKNCIFRGRATSSNFALFDTDGSTGTITVQDSEFVPSNPSATIDGLWTRNTNIYRANIHGTVDGMKADSNTLVQDSYIHNLSYFASDPNQGGGPTHNDTIQILSGTTIHITHNNLVAGSGDNSAVQITQDFGAVSGVYISSNWADGGGCTFNIAHKTRASLTTIYLSGNRFGRHQGFSGCTILISTKTTLSQNSGNVWDDTGLPIPAPQQHD